jgi:hypothetical protein
VLSLIARGASVWLWGVTEVNTQLVVVDPTFYFLERDTMNFGEFQWGEVPFNASTIG